MNKTRLSWVNPTQNTDGTAYNHVTQGAGYELALNSDDPTVTLPFALGTQFDMADLAAYQALPPGEHVARLRVVTREGVPSAWSNGATFRKIAIPLAPSAVAVD